MDNETKDKNEMTELKEKISQPFAFLNISANLLAAHCQAVQADTEPKDFQRAAILAAQRIVRFLG